MTGADGGEAMTGGSASGDTATEREVVPLLEPRDGLPPVLDTPDRLTDAVARFARGHGPVAVDAERASGYRYSQRAYLVQLRRDGAGTALIDPIACPDLSGLDAALADTELVLHAASQDLPCLAELGLRPRRLFDTELAGRLLGIPRVGLGAIVASVLGYQLEKGYSAADWSSRPLPVEWLKYAALDVEVLVALRDALEQRLADAGKIEWAREEFAAEASAPPRPPRREPWRRTSGIHRVRGRRALAVVRSLWQARDGIAVERDLAPGRVLQDAAIVAAARTDSGSPLDGHPGFNGRVARRYRSRWQSAIRDARQLEDSELPEVSAGGDGPPPAHRWADRDPAAAQRLTTARAVVSELAEQHTLPAENLIQPDAIRRLMWEPPRTLTAPAIGERLRAAGARPWQVDLVAAPLSAALSAALS